METFLTILYVFLAVTFVDIIWVFYIKYVAESRAILASVTASIIYILTAFVIITYTTNAIYIIPAVIGAAVGTYFAIKIHDFIEKRKTKIKK